MPPNDNTGQITQAKPPTKILLVDDSRLVRSEVSMMLQGGRYSIIEAANGVEGLAAAEKHPDVALIILDVNMPEMDGLTMAETLRTKRKAANKIEGDVPILMLTTETSKDLVLRGKKLGIAGWIVKPPQKGTLLAILQKVLPHGDK